MSNEVRNKELFYKIADVIENDLSVYDQSWWGAHIYETCPNGDDEALERTKARVLEQSCGTSHCIAGHAAVLAGYKPEVRKGYVPAFGKAEAHIVIEINWEEMFSPNGNVMDHPSDIGRKVLGLSPEEASILFGEYWRPLDWDDDASDEVNAKYVAEALRALGDGWSIYDVTEHESDEW